jgi:hypothetical protein
MRLAKHYCKGKECVEKFLAPQQIRHQLGSLLGDEPAVGEMLPTFPFIRAGEAGAAGHAELFAECRNQLIGLVSFAAQTQCHDAAGYRAAEAFAPPDTAAESFGHLQDFRVVAAGRGLKDGLGAILTTGKESAGIFPGIVARGSEPAWFEKSGEHVNSYQDVEERFKLPAAKLSTTKFA